ATSTSAPATTTATAVAPSKPKKVKREKVRFGQAPRNSLPAGPGETGVGEDVGEGASSAAVTPGGVMAAPGAVMAPTQSSTQLSATSDADPLAPRPPELKKTRYSARAKTEAADKAAAKAVKAK